MLYMAKVERGSTDHSQSCESQMLFARVEFCGVSLESSYMTLIKGCRTT